jgi:hypothetical protein
MATIFRARGYRFFFYAADLNEPIHVHIAKSGREAKFFKVWNRENDNRDDS